MNTIEEVPHREPGPVPQATKRQPHVTRVAVDDMLPSKAIAKAQADIETIENLTGTSKRQAPAALMALNMVDSAAYRATVRKLAPELEPELRAAGIKVVEARLDQSTDTKPAKAASRILSAQPWKEDEDPRRLLDALKKLAQDVLPTLASPDLNDFGVEARGEPVPFQAPRVDEAEIPASPSTQPVNKTMASKNIDNKPDVGGGVAVRPAIGEEEFEIPALLRKRFIVTDNKYYFRGEQEQLAFEDRGKKLSTTSDDVQVARSMVELAAAKQWSTIQVKGSIEFKREVWLSASQRGLDVTGYKPSKLDLARLEEWRSEQQPSVANSIEQALQREPTRGAATGGRGTPSSRHATHDERSANLTTLERTAIDTLKTILHARGDSDKAVEMATTHATRRFQGERVYIGKILDFGSAPYVHNKSHEPSYFVRLQTKHGEHTLWGVDLERALTGAGSKKGDEVAVACIGYSPVTVPKHEIDEHNKRKNMAYNVDVYRATWEITHLEKLLPSQKAKLQKAALHTPARQPIVPVKAGQERRKDEAMQTAREIRKSKTAEHAR